MKHLRIKNARKNLEMLKNFIDAVREDNMGENFNARKKKAHLAVLHMETLLNIKSGAGDSTGGDSPSNLKPSPDDSSIPDVCNDCLSFLSNSIVEE